MWNWIKRIFKLHTWVYSNPCVRTCSVCGRMEIEYCYPDEDDMLGGVHCYWTTVSEGDAEKHEKE